MFFKRDKPTSETMFLIIIVLHLISSETSVPVQGSFIRDGYRAISHFYGSLSPNRTSISNKVSNTTVINEIPDVSKPVNGTRNHITSFAKLKSYQTKNSSSTATTRWSKKSESIPSQLKSLFGKIEDRSFTELNPFIGLGQETMNFIRPWVISSGNLLADIQDAVPDVLTGSAIAIVMTKGILFATVFMIKVILLPLPFWIFLAGVLIVGGYLYTVSYEKGHEHGEEDAETFSEMFDNILSRSDGVMEGPQNYDQWQGQGQVQHAQATTEIPAVRFSQPLDQDEQHQFGEYSPADYYNHQDQPATAGQEVVRRSDYNYNNYYDQYKDYQGFQKRSGAYADYANYNSPAASVQQYSMYSPYSILSSNCTSCFQPVQHSLSYYQN